MVHQVTKGARLIIRDQVYSLLKYTSRYEIIPRHGPVSALSGSIILY